MKRSHTKPPARKRLQLYQETDETEALEAHTCTPDISPATNVNTIATPPRSKSMLMTKPLDNSEREQLYIIKREIVHYRLFPSCSSSRNKCLSLAHLFKAVTENTGL